MTNIKAIVGESYIRLLSILGMTATFFAMYSANTTSGWLHIYEHEIPTALIKKD